MNDELLVKFLLEETSPEEDLLVLKWLDEDPAHKRQMDNMRLIWNTSKNLADKSSVDEDAAWERFRDLRSKGDVKQQSIRSIFWKKPFFRAAAVLIMVASAWTLFTIFRTSSDTLTASGRVVTETLPDGSEVTLNKNSVLSYSFSAVRKQRRVTLEKGEVFFKVSRNKNKPFVIESKNVEIMVLGTSFNVKQKENSTEVIVETGIVRVSRGAQKVELHKGQRVLVKEGEEFKVRESSDQLYNYYRTRQFIADNTPLWRVVEVLNEAYQANIVIGNPEISDLTLTTTFKEEPIEDILRIITETFNISADRRDGKIILK